MPGTAGALIMVGMKERYPVSVAGVDLVAERPSRRGARLLREGAELPRDVWGKYQVTGTDGELHRLELTYSHSHLSPAVRVDDTAELIVLEPLPKWAYVIRFLLSLMSFAGVLIHGYVVVAASLGTLFLLARPGRGPRQVILASVLGVAALVAQILLFILL